jgi:hypothetical protein
VTISLTNRLLMCHRVRIDSCSRLVLRIDSSLPKEEFQTPSFRFYLLSCVMDCPLFPNASFNLSWRGESVLCLVMELTSSDLFVSDPPERAREVAYQIGSATNIRILSTNEPFQCSTAGAALLQEDLPQSDSKSPEMSVRVPWEALPFAGSPLEVQEAMRVIEAGLSVPSGGMGSELSKMKFKRPRGLLLSGPRGTGKTLLMNCLTEFFSPWIASVHSLSPDILLSRSGPLLLSFD